MRDERAPQNVLGKRINDVARRIIETGNEGKLLLPDCSSVKAASEYGVLQFNGEGLSCSSLVLGRFTLIKLNAGDYLEILTMTERTRLMSLLKPKISFAETGHGEDETKMKGVLKIEMEGEAHGQPFDVSSLNYLGETQNLEWRVGEPGEPKPKLLEAIDEMLTRVENGLAQMPQIREEKQGTV
ncbi:MAG: hypothetical protein WCT01_02375 [Candidatus Shapirobacteria bacterium]